MTIKESILAAIKKKFPGVNLSKARLDAIAAKIETIVIDDETKIDAALDSYNDFNPLADIAKNDDIIRNLQAQAKKDPKPSDKKPGEEKPADEKVDVPADTPEWMKPFMKQMEVMGQTLSALQGEKTAETIKSKAEALLKDIPVKYWYKRALPTKPEDVEAFVEEVKTDYAEFAKGLTDEGLSILATATTPAGGGGAGGGKGGDTKQASKEELESVANNIMP